VSDCPICRLDAVTTKLPDGRAACAACFKASEAFRVEAESAESTVKGGYVLVLLGLVGLGVCVVADAGKVMLLPCIALLIGIVSARSGNLTKRRLARVKR
jgi:hypothetical protein